MKPVPMATWYETEAAALIGRAEAHSTAEKETTEQFYRGLREIAESVWERLQIAREELDDQEIAREITRRL